MYPSLEEVKALQQIVNLVPVYKEIVADLADAFSKSTEQTESAATLLVDELKCFTFVNTEVVFLRDFQEVRVKL